MISLVCDRCDHIAGHHSIAGGCRDCSCRWDGINHCACLHNDDLHEKDDYGNWVCTRCKMVCTSAPRCCTPGCVRPSHAEEGYDGMCDEHSRPTVESTNVPGMAASVVDMTMDINNYRDVKPAGDMVNHPPHYTFGKIEVIDVLEDWSLGFHEANCVKYIARARHKGNELQDLKKARFYLDRRIAQLDGGA